MALTKSDIPDLLLPGLRADFELAYRSELDNGVADRLATVISTTQPVQKYTWLGAPPPMREFVDERRPSGLSAYAVAIEDKVFESTLAVDRRAIEDDQLDLIRMRVRELAQRVVFHRHQLVVEALATGVTNKCYDGQPLLSASHPVLGKNYSNLADEPFGKTALELATATMMALPDDANMPLGIVPDTLLVGPELLIRARELLESSVVVHVGGGSSSDSPTNYANALQGMFGLVVSPFLRGGEWFLLDTKRAVRSVILQQRSDVPVEFASLDHTTGAESAFLRDRFFYGVRGRYNVGYGLWQSVFGGGLS